MPEMAQIFTEESCMPSRRLLINFQLSRPYWVHVWAILGSCFGYFYNIFASRCLKWLQFSLESHSRILLNDKSLGPYLGHVWAILSPCLSYFYIIFACRYLKWLKFSLKSHVYQIKEYFLNLNY